MLERTDENFYKRKEKFVEPNARLEIDSVKVGVRLVIDLLNGTVALTEQAFASDEDFQTFATAIPSSDKTEVIAGEQFDKFFKKHSSFFKYFKELFETANEQAKARDAVAAETGEKARAERFKQLKQEIERAGGKVTLPDEQEK